MKVVILTTNTLHHTYYIKQLLLQLEIVGCIVEKNSVQPKFDTYHPYVQKRDEFEKEHFFGGKDYRMSDLCSVTEVSNINDSMALKKIKEWSPDVTFSFGVSRLNLNTINSFSGSLLNLHGGDPQKYRGLDSHLWTVYHNDFKSLNTSLHFLTPRLDTGDIVQTATIPLHQNMTLHELRYANTKVCVEISMNAIIALNRGNDLTRTAQKKLGRYYSHMPAVLIDSVIENFERHTRKL